MFGKLKKRFRNHARDDVCTALEALGIQARMAPRGHSEWDVKEYITSDHGKSFGVIDVATGPIRWVGVKSQREASGDADIPNPVVWYTEYGVPDSRLGPTFPEVRIESQKTFNRYPWGKQKDVKPHPGKDVDVMFAGDDFGLGVIDRLAIDVSLRKPIMESRWIEIGAYPKHHCWVISSAYVNDGFFLPRMWKGRTVAPSPQQWHCYQSLAHDLLETPVPPNT